MPLVISNSYCGYGRASPTLSPLKQMECIPSARRLGWQRRWGLGLSLLLGSWVGPPEAEGGGIARGMGIG